MERLIEKLSAFRVPLVVASAVLLFLSATGLFVAYAQPAEIQQETSLLDYEQRGIFDYAIYQKPAYLFGDIPLETGEEPDQAAKPKESPPTTPKFPVDIIDRFEVTFGYDFVPDQPEKVTSWSERVDIKATLQKPNMPTEEVILVPSTTKIGNFSVVFPLSSENITSNSTIIMTATVYATIDTATVPIFERFTQSLAIRPGGSLLDVDKNLNSVQRASFGDLSYEQRGEFSYAIYPKAGTPWPATVLRPPEPPPPPPPEQPVFSSKVLRPGDVIYPNLIDRMDMTYSYSLKSSKPLQQQTSQVEISAVLEAPKIWSKKLPLFKSSESGDFSVGFPLDMESFKNVLDTIKTETGATSNAYTLSIVAEVRTAARSDSGLVSEVFSQILSTDFGGGSLTWKEKLELTKPGSLKVNRAIPNPRQYLGLSLGGTKALALVFFILFLIPLGASVVLYWKTRPQELSHIEKTSLQIHKKYRERITDSNGQTPLSGEKVVSLSSIDDLIKVADELAKPIIHQSFTTSGERHDYYILDGDTLYKYSLSGDN